MLVSQCSIEDGVLDYILHTGRNPRFVLIDKKSYEQFCALFKTKERFVFKTEEENKKEKESKVLKIFSSAGVQVDILPIDTDKDFFEIV